MLYLSRYIGDKYGIIDTDDNVETVVTWQELRRILLLGINIVGVDYAIVNGFGRKKRILNVFGIEPYQEASSVTGRLAKLKALSGVDIRLRGDTIISISWNADTIKKGIRVLLSDYGSALGDRAFDNSRYKADTEVTFILDDKVRTTKASFTNFFSSCSVLDITEVTNQKTINNIYSAFIDQAKRSSIINFIDDHIIDADADRLRGYQAIGAVYSFNHPSGVVFTEEDKEFVSDHFRDMFLRLCHSKIAFAETPKAKMMLQLHLVTLRKHIDFWYSTQSDFTTVFNKDGCRILRILQEASMLNPKSLWLLTSYLTIFRSDGEIKSAYVDFCKRGYIWCLETAMKLGLSLSAPQSSGRS